MTTAAFTNTHPSSQHIEQKEMLIKFYKAHTAFNPVNSLTLPWLTDSPLPSSVSCDTIFMIIDEISFVS